MAVSPGRERLSEVVYTSLWWARCDGYLLLIEAVISFFTHDIVCLILCVNRIRAQEGKLQLQSANPFLPHP